MRRSLTGAGFLAKHVTAIGVHMKKLIVCRHGEIDHDRRLSATGETQIRALSGLLRSFLQPHAPARVKLLSSSAPRAVDSSRVLMRELGIAELLRRDCLWSGDGPAPHDIGVISEMVAELEDQDVVILMTHYEICREFPPRYARESMRVFIADIVLSRGQARIIDCVKKTDAVVG